MICLSGFWPRPKSVYWAFRMTSDMKRYIEVTKTISELIALGIKLSAVTTLLCATCFAQESANGAISTVRISPDLRQIVVRADGVLGRHTAFAFDKPYRLVVDFESTSLGKIPSKIKLEKPPISEIRLGKLENRARLVIDFGDNPVPSYAIERQENMAVIALGESGPPKSDSHADNVQESDRKEYKRSAISAKPVPLKKEHNQASEQVPAPAPLKNNTSQPVSKKKQDSSQAEYALKKAVLSNDLLLIEFHDLRNAAQTYSLAIEIDLKDKTLKKASLSNPDGGIKRFEIAEFEQPNDFQAQTTFAPPTTTQGPRKLGPSNTVFESRPMEKPKNVFNSMPSVTSIQPPEASVTQNPLKMEEFKLQVKKDH